MKENEMYLHVVLMAFNKTVTTDLRNQITAEFRSMPHKCEGLLRFDLIDNESRTSANYTHGLLSVFASANHFEAYRVGQAHTALMETLKPHIKDIVVLDSELHDSLDLDQSPSLATSQRV